MVRTTDGPPIVTPAFRESFSMMIRTAISALVASAALVGAAAPTVASAQAYGSGAYQGGAYDRNGYYYDPCRRSTTNRTTGGGLAGAGIGAAIGSSVAGRGAKTEGAVLGGLLGAVVGGNIGRSSAACAPGAVPPPPPPPPRAYNDYDRGYDNNTHNLRDHECCESRCQNPEIRSQSDLHYFHRQQKLANARPVQTFATKQKHRSGYD